MTEYPREWSCSVTVLRLESYLRGTMAWVEALAMAEHIEACPACAQRLALAVERGGRG